MELQALELEDTLLVAALVVLTVQRCQIELEVPVVADKEVIKQVAPMAVQILAVADSELEKRLERYKEELAEKVAEKAAGLAEKLSTP